MRPLPDKLSIYVICVDFFTNIAANFEWLILLEKLSTIHKIY